MKKLLKDVSKYEWFTLNPIEIPKENQVWIKGYYDRKSKLYEIHNFEDVNRERFLKGDREVYVDFTF